jgi:hypothetical protein
MGNRCPVLTETTGGTLRFGVVFRDTEYPDPHASADALYRAIDTKFGFNWDSQEGLYRDPWLKTCFSLNNWNNSQEGYPPYDE